MESVPAATSQRLVSLDVFRGVTIAAMLLVNNPGSWGAVYPPLRHAEWFGCTPTDLIFPWFLFIVGVAMAFSLRRYLGGSGSRVGLWQRVVRRGLLLFALGMLLNSFGLWLSLLFGDVQAFLAGWSEVRIPGVLQRISLVYVLAVVLIVSAKIPVQVGVSAAILGASWAVLAFIEPGGGSGMSPEGNAFRALDLLVMGESHLWGGSPTDPEGIASTANAIVTTMTGYWAGLLLRSAQGARSAVKIAVAGAIAVVAGWVWSIALPMSKPLWTGSFVLFTSGWACIALAACFWLVDVRGMTRWTRPMASMGVNAITVFVGSGLVARVLTLISVGDETLKGSIYNTAFSSWISPAELASLVFATATVLVWTFISVGFDKAGWRFKV